MKKNSIHILIVTSVALCAGAALPFLFGHSTIDPEQQSVKSEVPYCVTSPSVPDKITFAGQEIDLTRYDHRERMDREQMSFTYMHSTTMLTIKRANRFFPIIEPILKENGVPDDFKYLAVIESNLNTLARSPAGAAGMWQFMQTTGREFGLEVNPNIDDRYHVEKATRAACQYLKDAYQRYGNWLCVAAAYNGGQGGRGCRRRWIRHLYVRTGYEPSWTCRYRGQDPHLFKCQGRCDAAVWLPYEGCASGFPAADQRQWYRTERRTWDPFRPDAG